MKKYTSKILFILIVCLSNNLLEAQNQNQPEFPSKEKFKNTNITSKLISAPNNSWGYEILVDDKLTIHQPSIPAMPGNEGFKTKESAKKVADLVIKKMKNGEMPPSITTEEMKKLKVL